MAREKEDWQLANELVKPTRQELSTAVEEMKQFPYGELLVSIFQNHTTEDELMWGSGIVGNVKDEGINASMILRSNFHRDSQYSVYDTLVLNIYNGKFDEIPRGSWVVVGSARSVARISSQASEAGTWIVGQGNKRKWTLYMDFGEKGNFYLPSKFAKWTLGLLADVASSASEFYNPIWETPAFFDGQDLERPPR